VADELAAGGGEDADVQVGDEHEDCGVGPAVADADVVQAAGVAQGDFAVAVDVVGADSPVDACGCAGGPGVGSGVVGVVGGAAVAGVNYPRFCS
jgi:hypothetical protein